MNEDPLSKLYDALISARNNEADIRWKRIQTFLFLHSGALTYVAQFVERDSIQYYGACFFGIALALCWILVTRRGGGWSTYYIKNLGFIESLRPEYWYVEVFRGPRVRKLERGISIHGSIMFLTSVILVVWILLLVFPLPPLPEKGG